jgi:type VI secretion system protein VasD
MTSKALVYIKLIAVAVLATACASAPKPTMVDATVTTSADANADNAGRASPLLVRVFELNNRAAFEAADYVALFEREKPALGAEMIAVDEWILAPKEQRVLKRKLAPEARFIGVVAAYRDIERAHWRAVIPVTPQVTNTVTVQAGALAVTATNAPR